MCFSVNVNLVRDELENRYGASFPDRDRYSQAIIIMLSAFLNFRQYAQDRPDKVQLLKWGLIPSWTRNPEDANEIRYKTFNARAESVTSKPSFSKSFKSKRCIIPVKGFFEWQHDGE